MPFDKIVYHAVWAVTDHGTMFVGFSRGEPER
jgi:hypothetical protein